MGLTNGTNNYGLQILGYTPTGLPYISPLQMAEAIYGEPVGTARVSADYTDRSLGVVTDSSKSGITARPSIKSLSAYCFYAIKY